MTVEWTRLEDVPGLGPAERQSRPGSVELPAALRQGALCATLEEEGAFSIGDAHGHVARHVGVSGMGPPDNFHRTPAVCRWSWKRPDWRLEQVVLLSARPTAAIVQWRVVGAEGVVKRFDVSVVGPGDTGSIGAGPLSLEVGATPVTFAVWRPPVEATRRKMLERVLRQPEALVRRWTTRRAGAVRVDGFGEIANPIDLAIGMLPTLDGERFWIGTREGLPVEGAKNDRVLAALALAGVGRFQEAADLQGLRRRTEPVTAGVDRPGSDFLPLWTGIGESEADPSMDPLLALGPMSESLSRAIEARRAGDLDAAEDAWLGSLRAADRRGGWKRSDWDEHAGEAAGAVALFLYDVMGLRPDAPFGRLRMAPALPHSVDRLTVDELRVGQASLRFDYRRSARRTAYGLHPISGPVPLNVVLEPLLPADRAGWVEVDGEPADAELEPLGRRTRVRLQLPLDADREVVVHASPR